MNCWETAGENQITLDYTTREGETALIYGEDGTGNTCLDSVDSDIDYYANSSIINSQKFAHVLKAEIIGEWEAGYDRITINSDGTYTYVYENEGASYTETWEVKVLPNKVKIEFLNYKTWNVWGKYIESNNSSEEWDEFQYEDAAEELKNKDYRLLSGYEFDY